MYVNKLQSALPYIIIPHMQFSVFKMCFTQNPTSSTSNSEIILSLEEWSSGRVIYLEIRVGNKMPESPNNTTSADYQ